MQFLGWWTRCVVLSIGAGQATLLALGALLDVMQSRSPRWAGRGYFECEFGGMPAPLLFALLLFLAQAQALLRDSGIHVAWTRGQAGVAFPWLKILAVSLFGAPLLLLAFCFLRYRTC